MGCDIHFYVERREGNRWVSADRWKTEKDSGDKHVDFREAYYHDRNYDLFAILANVRNGSGFAGIKTGDGFVPISEPRDLPDDASPEVRAAAEAYGADGHSHSFLTVAEIMAFDWTQTTTLRGTVKPNEWAQWKLSGSPKSWAGAISGGGVLPVTPEQMEAAAMEVTGGDLWKLYHEGTAFADGPLAAVVYKKLGGTHEHGAAITDVTWGIPYYDAGNEFLSTTLPRMWRLGKPEDVRCVFFFDN